MTAIRIDRLLFFLRFGPSRTRIQRWIGQGHLRCNGERVTRADHQVHAGDVLTLPLARQVLVIEITALPSRRGPREEAARHYRTLDAGGSLRQSGGEGAAPERPAREDVRP